MDAPAPTAHLTVSPLLATLPGRDGERWVVAFEHGTLEVELYAPRGADPQHPHTRDEVYVVVSGRGDFMCDGRRMSFGPGDLFFVAAGVEHRFEQFSDDFATWVVFFGPSGGEIPQHRAEGARHLE